MVGPGSPIPINTSGGGGGGTKRTNFEGTEVPTANRYGRAGGSSGGAGRDSNSAGVTTVVINAAGSGKVLKINALTAAAIGSTTGVTLNYYDTAGRHTAAISTVSLGTTVSVPTNSSLILISKENSFYLEEGRQIGVVAQSNAGTLDVICSYEEIS